MLRSHLLREMWIEIIVIIALRTIILSHLLREMWIEIIIQSGAPLHPCESSPAGDVD